QVYDAPGEATPQVLLQLFSRVLQPQHEKEQEHADLGADVDKVCTNVQGRQPPVAKGETSQQVERDGREAPAARNARQHSKADDDKTQFDQDMGYVVSGRVHALRYSIPTKPTLEKDVRTIAMRAIGRDRILSKARLQRAATLLGAVSIPLRAQSSARPS